MYSPYDFNQSIAHRAEYVEERLKGGSPVVGLSYDRGVLLFTVKRTQRKIFEVYDQLMYSAIGNQTDVEAVRLAAIDFAHAEGFQRSPDDVSIQRLVGFAISPPLKRSFGDPLSTPNVLRAIFAELGKKPERDVFFLLNYDGEFSNNSRCAAIAGRDTAEAAMREELEAHTDTPDLATALQRAVATWRRGAAERQGEDEDDKESSETRAQSATAPDTDEPHTDPLHEALKEGEIEAAILERDTPRESKFRLLRSDELSAVI